MSELSRRGFIELLGVSTAGVVSGPAQLAEEQDVEQYGLLLGDDADLPAPNGRYLNQWDTYRFLFVSIDEGRRYTITHRDGSWEQLPVAAQSVTGDRLELTPTDVRTISSPEAGWYADHDGSGTNTTGLARYNGTDWISQVDGSTIS